MTCYLLLFAGCRVLEMGLAVTKQEEFWEACGFGNTERVRKLIADGIDVNWVSYTVRQVFILLLRLSLGLFSGCCSYVNNGIL